MKSSLWSDDSVGDCGRGEATLDGADGRPRARLYSRLISSLVNRTEDWYTAPASVCLKPLPTLNIFASAEWNT
jgi:hypothetical protein